MEELQKGERDRKNLLLFLNKNTSLIRPKHRCILLLLIYEKQTDLCFKTKIRFPGNDSFAALPDLGTVASPRSAVARRKRSREELSVHAGASSDGLDGAYGLGSSQGGARNGVLRIGRCLDGGAEPLSKGSISRAEPVRAGCAGG